MWIGMPKDWPRDDEMIQHWKLQKENEKFERTNNLRLNTVRPLFPRACSLSLSLSLSCPRPSPFSLIHLTFHTKHTKYPHVSFFGGTKPKRDLSQLTRNTQNICLLAGARGAAHAANKTMKYPLYLLY